MKNEKRKGMWIPNEILMDKQLDPTDKIILTEIYSLCKLPTGCIASDRHFAELVGIGRESINKRINKLKKLGYFTTKNEFKNKQCVGRVITNVSSYRKHTIVPQVGMGSSTDTKEVVPRESKGSSVENTINTSNNSEILIQEKIQETRTKNLGVSLYQYNKNKNWG